MYNVILQPTVEDNQNSTIRKGVELRKIQSYLKLKEFEMLSDIYKSGIVHVWGIAPSKDNHNQNAKQWDKIQRGDIAIFYAEFNFYASATVTYKVHNPALARYFWGEKKPGETWEYVYFLDEIKNQSIDIGTVNTLLGYSPTNHLSRVTVLDQEKSNIMMDTFDFYSSTYTSILTKEEVENNIKEIINNLEKNASLDREVRGRARKEQSALRSYLFGNKKTCNCGICGEEFPVDLLVAAHIKKRALATIEEQKDIENIAIPMCKFGCDDLFEKGYISVLDKKVVSLIDTDFLPSVVKIRIQNLEGKVCSYENENNTDYFLWHYKHHKK
ncbi:HNH endonuclease [Bacillus paramycoides]|uniref:HNH endonuclease n=1 Tax=Bacillus paramycoides TaxID=2026194 RepID=UPI002E1EA5F5|nr:HNH endonuclease [Bacillus paramycoides]